MSNSHGTNKTSRGIWSSTCADYEHLLKVTPPKEQFWKSFASCFLSPSHWGRLQQQKAAGTQGENAAAELNFPKISNPIENDNSNNFSKNTRSLNVHGETKPAMCNISFI